MFPQELAIYELESTTREAGLKLAQAAASYFRACPIDLRDKSGSVAIALHNEKNDFVDARLQENHADLMRALGMDTPVIFVRQEPSAFPRAYEAIPTLYAHVSYPENPALYLVCPVDYKGRHFVPEAGRLLDAEEVRKKRVLIFGSEWVDNYPLFSRRARGTALPADYVPPAQNPDGDFSTRYRFFRAAGKTAAYVREIRRLEDARNKATSRLFAYIQGLIPDLKKEGMLSVSADDPRDFRANFSLGTSDAGRPLLTLSVRDTKHGHSIGIENNKWFTATDTGYIAGGDLSREYLVFPNRDTAEGRELGALMKPLQGRYPGPALFPRLLSDDMNGQERIPVIKAFGDAAYLLYHSDEKKKGYFAPPGAVPVSPQEYNWLMADEHDRNIGIVPPPRPPSLRQE